MKIIVEAEAEPLPTNWRCAQAEHQERLARLSTALAAAYEGDIGFARTKGEAAYLEQRARAYRRNAKSHRAKAGQLRHLPQ